MESDSRALKLSKVGNVSEFKIKTLTNLNLVMGDKHKFEFN